MTLRHCRPDSARVLRRLGGRRDKKATVWRHHPWRGRFFAKWRCHRSVFRAESPRQKGFRSRWWDGDLASEFRQSSPDRRYLGPADSGRLVSKLSRTGDVRSYWMSRYRFEQALVGRSQDSPRMPTPGTRYNPASGSHSAGRVSKNRTPVYVATPARAIAADEQHRRDAHGAKRPAWFCRASPQRPVARRSGRKCKQQRCEGGARELTEHFW
jgi:hypothetical protein